MEIEFTHLMRFLGKVLDSKPHAQLPNSELKSNEDVCTDVEDAASRVCISFIDESPSELEQRINESIRKETAANLTLFPWRLTPTSDKLNFEAFVSVLLAAIRLLEGKIPDTISLGHLAILRRAVELLIGLGIHSCITARRSQPQEDHNYSGEGIQFVWFNLKDEQKRELMHRTAHSILALRRHAQLATFIDSKYLDSLLLVLWNETRCTERRGEKSPASLIQELVDSVRPDCTIESLLRLQAGRPPLRTPNWIKLKAGQLMSHLLVKENGLKLIMEAMEAIAGSEQFSSDWKASSALGRIVSRCPESESGNQAEYYRNICTQVREILTKDQDWARKYASHVNAIVRELSAAKPELVESLIFDPLFGPLEACCNNVSILSDPISLTSSLEGLWVLASRNPPQEKFVKLERLQYCAELLFRVALATLNSVSAHRHSVLNLFAFLLESNPESVGSGLVSDWESHNWSGRVCRCDQALEFKCDEFGISAFTTKEPPSLPRAEALLSLVGKMDETIGASIVHRLFSGALKHFCLLSSVEERRESDPRSGDGEGSNSVLVASEKQREASTAIHQLLIFIEGLLESFQDQLCTNAASLIPVIKDVVELKKSGLFPKGSEELECLVMGIASAIMMDTQTNFENADALKSLEPILSEWGGNSSSYESQENAKSLFKLLSDIKLNDWDQAGKTPFRQALAELRSESIPEQAGALTVISKLIKEKGKEALENFDQIISIALGEKIPECQSNASR